MRGRLIFAGLGLSCMLAMSGAVFGDSHVEDEIRQMLMEDNTYTRANLKGREDTISKDGSLEFWSSGGLLQEVSGSGLPPAAFESFSLTPKHIKVISLADGQVAVAMYYSEGSFQREGSDLVSHYLTRATQVFVKENGEWKARAAHWSPVVGGSGTDQTAIDD